MPIPKRIPKMIFILVPAGPHTDSRETIRAAQTACRVAHQLGWLPFAPMLYYASYLSIGELSMEIRDLSNYWIKRCERLWLRFPHGEEDKLDTIAYDILEENHRMGTGSYNEGRRPVYQLHPTGDEKVGYIPIPMTRYEVRELLNINLTAGLTARCM